MGLITEAVAMAWDTLTQWPLLGLGLAAAVAALPAIYRGDNPR